VSEDLLPIGRFARLCRLSVKQLRHYDDLGLLTPARVDPDSGYRYYRPSQARAAMSIGLLRSLEVPLAAIGRVPAGPLREVYLTALADTPPERPVTQPMIRLEDIP
jgi:hypothetical protein